MMLLKPMLEQRLKYEREKQFEANSRNPNVLGERIFFDGGTKNRMAGRIKLVSNMGPGSPGNDGTSESKAEHARLCQKFRILNSWS